jgi:hypothetical protein
MLNVIGIKPLDKMARAAQQSAAFEAGRVHLRAAAPWLADFETELLGFPNARHDDQVDSAVQFLYWATEQNQFRIPIVSPYVFSAIFPAARLENNVVSRRMCGSPSTIRVSLFFLPVRTFWAACGRR